MAEPEHTPDGRFVIINGRRWRATDPEIPPETSARLRSLLMAARRDVGAALRAEDAEAEREARARVQLAKVALGERGTPWWEQTAGQRRQRWQEGLEALDRHDA
ncbi:hypothetical protein [Lentzea jiangxiensis]|uniref:Biopolymer transporter Tol n=1 Tax=Lentzea jiangxiensis TaxID=641025 RepID=A0A1H0JQI3_9PSEU|nr:hypothetical protein [Lentzea jiangxiensis]SDO46016.1 hypothetical protein SAMN05421507_102598 [Lentzea jiangxiensis]